jgi:hypothetical protein
MSSASLALLAREVAFSFKEIPVLTMRSLIHVAYIVTVLTLSASAAEADEILARRPKVVSPDNVLLDNVLPDDSPSLR